MTPMLVPTLAELACELDQAVASYKIIDAAMTEREAVTGLAVPKGDPMDDAFNAACDRCSGLVLEIANLPAQTAHDLRTKARALEWHAFSDGQEPATYDERLAFQLVRALLDGLPGDPA